MKDISKKPTKKQSIKKRKALQFLALLVMILGIIKVYADQMEPPKHEESQINLYYGLKSYDQFQSLMTDRKMDSGEDWVPMENVGTVAFHWAQIKADSLGRKIDIKSDMPLSYDQPIEAVKGVGSKALLSFYMASGYELLFSKGSANEQVDWFLTTAEGLFFSKANFDGIVIDFESLPKNQQENYLAFIEALSKKLKERDQKLWVAIQPTTVTDYDRLLKSVDQAILMFHDYEAKKLSIKRVNSKILTPLVPISKLDKDLANVVGTLKDTKLKTKLRLQINMATAQWKVKEGKLLNVDSSGNYAYPYRPEYSTLIGKWQQMQQNKKTFEAGYMDYDQSPYLYYYDEADKTYNTILYENEKSVKAKMEVAKKYGITRFSVWRLGNIPSEGNLGLDMEKLLLTEGLKNN